MTANKPKIKFKRYVIYTLALIALIFIGILGYVNSLKTSPLNTILVAPNQLIPASKTCLNLLIQDGYSKKPVKNAEVSIQLKSQASGKTNELGNYLTDESGRLGQPIMIPDLSEGEYLLVIQTSSPLGNDQISKIVALRRPYKLLLSTDKPLYQPGQTIHIKTIALNQFDSIPAKNVPLTFEVEDHKGNIVYKKNTATSSYGIAAVDFILADEINLGEYRVKANILNAIAEKVVTVKKYTLPKFKAEIRTDKSFYLPGEILKGNIKTNYFFNKPVANGTIKINLFSFEEKFNLLKTINGRSDANGNLQFECPLPKTFFGSPLSKGDAILKIEASVTDTANQTEKAERILPVSKEAIKITIIPESGNLIPGIENIIFFATAYPDGQPAKTALEIKTGKDVFHEKVQTNQAGIAQIILTPPKMSDYEFNYLSVSAADSQDNKGTASFPDISDRAVQDIDRLERKIRSYGRYRMYYYGENPVFDSDDFLLRPDKAIYKAGENITITILSLDKEGLYYLDLVKNKQTVLTKIIEVKNNAGSLTFGLPLDLSGPLTISAFHILEDGNIARDNRIIYVETANRLKIKTVLDKRQYQPGETAQIDLQVTNAQGIPQPAALGLNIVDEGVFALAEADTGLLKAYYEIEKDIMKPRYQIKSFTASLLVSTPNEKESEHQSRGLALLSSLEPVELPSNASASFLRKQSELAQKKEDFNDLVGEIVMGALMILGFISAILIIFVFPLIFVYKYKSRALTVIFITTWLIMLGSWLFHGVLSVVVIPSPLLLGLITAYIIFALAVTVTRKGWLTKLTFFIFLTCFIGLGMCVPQLLCSKMSANAITIESCKRQIEALSALNQTKPAMSIRQYFPETLFWQPELITDEKGYLRVAVPLADSITSWRVLIDGISANGILGSEQKQITVLQDFFIDLNLARTFTQGDEISLPVIIYNYLKQGGSVTVNLTSEDWFELLDEPSKTMQLKPNEILPVYFRIRLKDFGEKQITVSARSFSGFQDTLKKSIEILPNGEEIQAGFSNRLITDVTQPIIIPENAIPGTGVCLVKIYPGVYTQVVDGLERMIRLPHGCFEQTSSTTYPNVLILSYLKQTGKLSPSTAMQLEQAVNLGYQRLLNFEVSGGGFSLFGHAPASEYLTAYGILEFTDMAKVYPVNKNLIGRTQEWLINRQAANGLWNNNVKETAYITWALAESGIHSNSIERAVNFIRSQKTENCDAYLLALCANALVAYDSQNYGSREFIRCLEKNVKQDIRTAYWESGRETLMYASGRNAEIETTALALYALIKGKGNPQIINKGLTWLIQNKDPEGGWYSTQATILSIKALLAAMSQPLPQEQQLNVVIKVNQQQVAVIQIDKNNFDVLQQINLKKHLRQEENIVELIPDKGANLSYQISVSYYLPWTEGLPRPPTDEPLRISVKYDKTHLRVNEQIKCNVKVSCHSPLPAGMILVDLGVPPGFAPDLSSFDKLVADKRIAKFSLTGRQITLYLEKLDNGEVLEFYYLLKALYPLKAKTPLSKVYEYYNPEKQSQSAPIIIEVK